MSIKIKTISVGCNRRDGSIPLATGIESITIARNFRKLNRYDSLCARITIVKCAPAIYKSRLSNFSSAIYVPGVQFYSIENRYWTIMEFSISFLSINIYKYRRYLFQPLSINSISFVFYYLEKGQNFETVLLLCFLRWTKLKFNTFISMRMHFQSRIFFFFCIWQSTKKKIRASISLETVQFTTIARLSSLELN